MLRDLADAGRRVRSRSNAQVLRLCTVDFLAHEFLIPRLPAFQARFPEVELRIETSMRVVELHTSELDAALRVRGKAEPGLTSVPVGPVIVTPVCSRDLAKRLRSLNNLGHATLIEMRGAGPDIWASFMKACGVARQPHRILSFEGYFETLTAAERGLGIAFGLFPMTSDWVLRGRLCVPFPLRKPVAGGAYLVFRDNDPRHALLTEIAGWLGEQYSALPSLPAGRIANLQTQSIV